MIIMNNELNMITPNMRFAGIIAVAASLLLVPYLVMKLAGNMKWSSFDFIILAVLLFGMAIVIEIILRLVTATRNRIILVLAALGILALIWIELAVGLWGGPLAGN